MRITCAVVPIGARVSYPEQTPVGKMPFRLHSVMLVWLVKFELIFSYVSRLIFVLIWCTGDKSSLKFESHDDSEKDLLVSM